ncbi:MAG: divergent polysaccharide deacetylase family protein [Candidatus Cloacimonetes bacterium]|nr:divergent polysaccharide deacetylase family protein [Candidatus Cloacimonadota bacterium]
MEKNPMTRILWISILLFVIIFMVASCKTQKGLKQDIGEADLKNSKDSVQENHFDLSDSLLEGEQGDASQKQTPGKGDAKSRTSAVADSSLKNYKYSWTDSENIPPVIIIVDDFGYATGSLLQSFANLPKEVAFAILPDLAHTQAAAQAAQNSGRDVLIHCPMEATISKTSPGKRYLKPGQDGETVRDMLDSFYAQMPMAIGLNNHMGSTATQNKDLMQTVLEHLRTKGLLFVDSVTIGNTAGYRLAQSVGMRPIKRDLFLDVPDNSDATIAARISDLGRFRGRVEPVIIITHCHNNAKLVALQKFLTQIQDMGVRLTSLSGWYGSGGVALGN